MDWGDAATWTAAVIAVFAAFVAIRQARKANSSAERSVAAAERSATADEQMAELAKEQASLRPPRWRFESLSEANWFALVNESDWPAYGVTLRERASGGPRILMRDNADPRTICPRGRYKFVAVPVFDQDEDAIIVRWHWSADRSGEEQTWSSPLPPVQP